MEHNDARPVSASRRIVVLDALRGFALMGIALANFPEFSLWSFLSDAEQGALPTAAADGTVRYLQYLLVDGKFYTIFSVLFGIGFSIIISHALERGADGLRVFRRRMLLLLLIGLLHLVFIWSGDILALYAALGLLLPLFRNRSERQLLAWAFGWLLLPVLVAAWRSLSGLDPSEWLYQQAWAVAGSQGISEENYAVWLRDAQCYADVFRFLLHGAVERMWEFVSWQRYFKVLGLFLVGYYIGKSRLHLHLDARRPLLVRIAGAGLLAGLPLSALYAFDCVGGHPWGPVVHELLYALSVYPLGFAYMALFCLAFLRFSSWRGWRILACPGRMALTCYIGQSLAGIVLFYGIGFGLGTGVGLWPTELIALAVFAFEIMVSWLWLRFFNFGPLEWIWRMLTYGKWFRLVKTGNGSVDFS